MGDNELLQALKRFAGSGRRRSILFDDEQSELMKAVSDFGNTECDETRANGAFEPLILAQVRRHFDIKPPVHTGIDPFFEDENLTLKTLEAKFDELFGALGDTPEEDTKEDVPNVLPLIAEGDEVCHENYGNGIVVQIDYEHDRIAVRFGDRVRRFRYPDILLRGKLCKIG